MSGRTHAVNGRSKYYLQFLEMKRQRGRSSTRIYVVSAAKCRKKIVERRLIRKIYNADTHTPLIPIAVENIVMPQGKIEQIT